MQSMEGRAGCPFCRRPDPPKRIPLTKTHPELAREWHPTKNGPLTPTDIAARSERRGYDAARSAFSTMHHHLIARFVTTATTRSGLCPHRSQASVSIENVFAESSAHEILGARAPTGY